MSLPERLKAARAALKLTQKQMAEQSAVSARSYQGYEDGRSVPGGEAIAAFVALGINANWLLSGHGPMLFADSLDAARTNRSLAILEEGKWAITKYALSEVDRHWFVTSPGDPDHGLNAVVEDYNAGKIFNDPELRKVIPTVTIEELAKWGSEALAWKARLQSASVDGRNPGNVAQVELRDEGLESKLDGPPAVRAKAADVPLNQAAMRAIITGVVEGMRDRDVSAAQIAERAVELYCRALAEDLITPTGIGKGGSEAA